MNPIMGAFNFYVSDALPFVSSVSLARNSGKFWPVALLLLLGVVIFSLLFHEPGDGDQ